MWLVVKLHSKILITKISDRLTENFHNCGCGAPHRKIRLCSTKLQFNGKWFTSMVVVILMKAVKQKSVKIN